MITALLSPRFLMALAAVVALGVAYVKGRSDGAAPAKAAHERDRTAWADERTKAAQRASEAMRLEIEAHNATQKELEAANERGKSRVAEIEQREAVAADRAAAATHRERRLRDELATHHLATDAAIAAAGVSAVCAPATEAASLYADLLGRYRERARSATETGRGISAFAERQTAAISECAERAEAMIRRSTGMPAAP